MLNWNGTEYMKDEVFKLMLALTNQEQQYAIAVAADLTDKEALDLLGFDCHQYGVPLKEDNEESKT